MIRIASTAAKDKLTKDRPFYLEFGGEAAPELDSSYSEVMPAGGATPQTTSPAPVYEYWWTVGHPGLPMKSSSAFAKTLHLGHAKPLWEDLDNAGVEVQVYFPTDKGWRIKEIIASVNYLTPLANQHQLWEHVSDVLAKLSPLATDASGLAGLAGGPIAASTGKALGAIAKLTVASVPQNDLSWSVEKVAGLNDDGLPLQGVSWHLPANVFNYLGGRVTGSLALSLIPAAVTDDQPASPGDVLCKAVVHCKSGGHELPLGSDTFLKFQISPKSPS